MGKARRPVWGRDAGGPTGPSLVLRPFPLLRSLAHGVPLHVRGPSLRRLHVPSRLSQTSSFPSQCCTVFDLDLYTLVHGSRGRDPPLLVLSRRSTDSSSTSGPQWSPVDTPQSRDGEPPLDQGPTSGVSSSLSTPFINQLQRRRLSRRVQSRIGIVVEEFPLEFDYLRRTSGPGPQFHDHRRGREGRSGRRVDDPPTPTLASTRTGVRSW